jgi:actin related protein 2/3 complex subunit 1A/1B
MPKHQLAKSLSFHSFNGDQSKCVLSENNEYARIFKTNGSPQDTSKWTLDCELAEDNVGEKTEQQVMKKAPPLHPGYVSGMDWCAATNAIVTCGHDRSAYVWKEEGGVWKPLLVILRINRAATAVKWSPDGAKFAVASGAKCVPVCHYENQQNWWISKMIKKHKSTVLCLDWSPCGKSIVTGGCDFKCRIFSAHIGEIDGSVADASDFSMWAKKDDFGECLAEFDQAKAWVQGVAWCPSGNKIAFVGHGSTLHVATLKDNSVNTVYSVSLPFHDVNFISESALVATGFDCNPHVYKASGDDWKLDKKLDKEEDGEEKKMSSAMARFKQADSKGQTDSQGDAILTFHKNCIRDVEIHGPKGDKKTLTTSGLDGRIITWNL